MGLSQECCCFRPSGFPRCRRCPSNLWHPGCMCNHEDNFCQECPSDYDHLVGHQCPSNLWYPGSMYNHGDNGCPQCPSDSDHLVTIDGSRGTHPSIYNRLIQTTKLALPIGNLCPILQRDDPHLDISVLLDSGELLLRAALA
jgi:hypothetical protein